MLVSQIRNTSDIDFVFPGGFSFFEPYLQYHIREILEVGGEAMYQKLLKALFQVFSFTTTLRGAGQFTRDQEKFLITFMN